MTSATRFDDAWARSRTLDPRRTTPTLGCPIDDLVRCPEERSPGFRTASRGGAPGFRLASPLGERRLPRAPWPRARGRPETEPSSSRRGHSSSPAHRLRSELETRPGRRAGQDPRGPEGRPRDAPREGRRSTKARSAFHQPGSDASRDESPPRKARPPRRSTGSEDPMKLRSQRLFPGFVAPRVDALGTNEASRAASRWARAPRDTPRSTPDDF